VIAACPKPGRVGVQGEPGGGFRAAQGCLECSDRELVNAERSCQRIAPQEVDEVGTPEQQPCLWTAEQLVAAACHQVCTFGQCRCGIRLLGQEWIRRQKAAPDVDHDGHGQTGQTCQLGDRHR